MKTLIAVSLIALTGCSGMATMGNDFTMSGNAEGIKQFYTGLNGTIKEGKQSADAPSEYLAFRTTEEKEVTKRASNPSFLGKLFGESTAPTTK